MSHRYARRVDHSQAAIVATLMVHGFDVEPINAIVDLLVTKHGQVWLVECKTDRGKTKTVVKTNRSTAARQAGFAARFPVVRLTSAEDAATWARGIVRVF